MLAYRSYNISNVVRLSNVCSCLYASLHIYPVGVVLVLVAGVSVADVIIVVTVAAGVATGCGYVVVAVVDG